MDHSQWTPSTAKDHKLVASDHKTCKTQAARDVIKRDHGIRYSVLNELPYFDPLRMCIIVPMHNLLLGTAKRMVEM